MSSKARRIDATGAHPFAWAQATAPPVAPSRSQPGGAAAAASSTANGDLEDRAALEARLAALERDAFSKGFAQGERAGAEMRRPLGIAVFSGMLGVTFFGIFLTPVFYYVLERLAGESHLAPSEAEILRVGEVAAQHRSADQELPVS